MPHGSGLQRCKSRWDHQRGGACPEQVLELAVASTIAFHRAALRSGRCTSRRCVRVCQRDSPFRSTRGRAEARTSAVHPCASRRDGLGGRARSDRRRRISDHQHRQGRLAPTADPRRARWHSERQEAEGAEPLRDRLQRCWRRPQRARHRDDDQRQPAGQDVVPDRAARRRRRVRGREDQHRLARPDPARGRPLSGLVRPDRRHELGIRDDRQRGGPAADPPAVRRRRGELHGSRQSGRCGGGARTCRRRAVERLKKLDELRTAGLVTDAEYEAKKAQLLAEL